MEPIYLDYNATTPIDPRVLEAMLPFLGNPVGGSLGNFGNPSSTHSYGKITHAAIDDAREQVAALLGAQPDEIVFTSGGTEASNHALKGAFFAKHAKNLQTVKAHIITSAIEHPATLKPCDFLHGLGCRITVLGVDRHGLVDPEAVRAALTPETILVSIMHANNEVGTVQPIAEIAKIVKRHSALMHTDAAQSLGKIRVDVNELGVDLLSVAGHKLYAPKGVGALFVRREVKLEPVLHGADHERGQRAGTENVPNIVALGQACEIAGRALPTATEKMRGLRDRLWNRLQTGLGERIVLNGHPELRLPNTLNINFVSHVGADLLARIPQLAASTGSACHEGRIALSPVLAAMGVAPEIGQGAIRLSVGRYSAETEIDQAAHLLIEAAQR